MISNYRKLFASAIAAIAMALPLSAATETAVVVISSDGSQTEIALDHLDRIDVGSSSATLRQTDGITYEYAYSNLDRILIATKRSEVQGILGKDEIAVWPTVTTGMVYAAGLNPGDNVAAHSIGGSLMSSVVADTNGSVSIDLSDCPAGIYIITANKHSVKIIKK